MGSEGFQELVQKAQDGDRGAMDRVIEILRPHIEPLARQYADPIKPVESTADLLQESCLRAWNKIGTFQGGSNDQETFAIFRVWIGQIVRRLGIDSQRTQGRQRRSPPQKLLRLGEPKPGGSTTAGAGMDATDPGPSPSADLRSDELAGRVQAVLDAMEDETNAAIVRLTVFEGLSISDAAKRLGLGYEMVRERYWASIEHLERELKEWL